MNSLQNNLKFVSVVLAGAICVVTMATPGMTDRSPVDAKREKKNAAEHDSFAAKKPRLSTEEHQTDVTEEEFPSTLEGFKYYFNKDGQLRHTETDKPFQFVVKEGDHDFNQRRYEALGEIITEHVYELLEMEANLKRIPIPSTCESGHMTSPPGHVTFRIDERLQFEKDTVVVPATHLDATADEPRSFIFSSKTKFDDSDKVLVLIHGDGVVRAGQWTRKLIINDCLDSGTQLPYIKRAKELGYEVLVMNSNLNRAAVSENKREKPIRSNGSPKAHVLYVWDEFLADAKSVAVVAHSFGGVCTVNLAMKRRGPFLKKVSFVAFTDSAHSMVWQETPTGVRDWFAENSINWVRSDQPLGTELTSPKRDSPRVSAGTTKHEETSWTSIDLVFKQLKKFQEKRDRMKDKTEL